MQNTDLIPHYVYEELYNWLVLIILLIFFLKSFGAKPNNLQLLGYIFLIFSIFYIGYRPFGSTMGDMGSYSRRFKELQAGATRDIDSDLLFYYFSKVTSYFLSVKNYFLVIAAIYVLPLYKFSSRNLKENWVFIFIALCASFSFWTYGTNGIRNGMATSLFILAFAYYNNKRIMWSILFLSFSMHNSMIIPIAAYGITFFINKPKFFLFIWGAAIPLSLLGGVFFQSIFSTLGFEERTAGYLTGGEQFQEQFSATGFRWDFILYSFVPVYAGYFYIVNMKIKDKMYYSLFGTYAIANAVWILVIRANFSNRFAYLSWFLMAIVIFYPLYRYKMFKNQYTIAALIMLAYFSFTFFMNVIL
ncbi:EpsG family protein [Weeksellaceae bacterium KMM 9713]|uniref:EpsG family protein n=1 Tax=Profundicola chukchiensis TaxID=2961959 RepID=A0A9X4MYT5_9FLAO|nr:EpsG family protein [Profundicola chukchiensis]MDG4944801.1 EpsG family protein [Profundicola chukchiensis]